jgi:acetyl-CoA carboxylase carboxyltransferase component
VTAGDRLLVLESMKMEHPVVSPVTGRVSRLLGVVGLAVGPGDLLAEIEPLDGEGDAPVGPDREVRSPGGPGPSPGGVRADLAEVRRRQELTRDGARPEAVGKRRRLGKRTARENVEAVCDPGSFVEYGALAIAAQRGRRELGELLARTPADGLVAGLGRVEGAPVCVLAYDYTVLAGTQGQLNHEKKDRLFALAEHRGLPVVFFTEGGGGRPGDTDATTVTGLETMAFALFARLSGRVPLVGVASGRCFAGNAALLGCCDIVVATADATVGMGGPAMIEGGGLGVVGPEAIGPVAVQEANGVVDVVVADEIEGAALARRAVSLLRGRTGEWVAPDRETLREVVPANRREVYDVRPVLATLADVGSVLELGPAHAPGMVTALATLEGRPLGILANNSLHLSGALDAAGSAKAARFLGLCRRSGLPVLFLCDTPGFMVGPEAEAEGLVRRAGDLFIAGAALTAPFATVIRKAYGLGAQAMAGGSFRSPVLIVAWPTGELGGMGLEGAVRLGFRRELDAVEDGPGRQALFDDMVARAYERGQALNVASHFEIDDVIDPAETRARLVQVLWD